MVHTNQTRSVNCGRRCGRGAGGRRVPGRSMSFKLGPHDESMCSRHTSVTPSWSRSATPGSNPTQGSVRERPIVAPPPTCAKVEERIESMWRKKVELQDKLAYVEWDNNKTKRMLDNLQQAHFRRLTERDNLLEERDTLREERDSMREEMDNLRKERDSLQEERDLLKLALDHERKTAARCRHTRVEDRTRFCKKVTIKYTKEMKGHIAAWIQNFKSAWA